MLLDGTVSWLSEVFLDGTEPWLGDAAPDDDDAAAAAGCRSVDREKCRIPPGPRYLLDHLISNSIRI